MSVVTYLNSLKVKKKKEILNFYSLLARGHSPFEFYSPSDLQGITSAFFLPSRCLLLLYPIFLYLFMF